MADYCLENIGDFAERIGRAYSKMYKERIPLYDADYALYCDINDAIDTCTEDYGIDYDTICADDVFFAGLR